MPSFFDAAGIGAGRHAIPVAPRNGTLTRSAPRRCAVRISVTRTGTRAQGAQSPRAAPSVFGLVAETERKGVAPARGTGAGPGSCAAAPSATSLRPPADRLDNACNWNVSGLCDPSGRSRWPRLPPRAQDPLDGVSEWVTRRSTYKHRRRSRAMPPSSPRSTSITDLPPQVPIGSAP